jgi:DNA-binding MarR family transcriptional regulator
MTSMLRSALADADRYVYGEVAAHHPGLRPAHLRLFGAGELDGTRVTSLAARAGMTKQAMHELVVHLERSGYLHRELDPADERVRRVTLTDRGRALEADLAAAVARLHDRWRVTLGEELYTALWTALERLTR